MYIVYAYYFIENYWHNLYFHLIENINILNIKNDLYQMINDSKDIEEEDKKHLKDSINRFITKQFFLPRNSLEKKSL